MPTEIAREFKVIAFAQRDKGLNGVKVADPHYLRQGWHLNIKCICYFDKNKIKKNIAMTKYSLHVLSFQVKFT